MRASCISGPAFADDTPLPPHLIRIKTPDWRRS
jgi:hypothetical protein